MQSAGNFVFNLAPGFQLTASAFDVWLKSFAVLMLAGGTCLIWRRASAATRHLIWFLALAVLPALPLPSSMLPSWQRPLWSVSARVESGNQVSFALELGPAAAPRITPQPMPAIPGVGRNSEVPRPSHIGRQLAAQFNRSWLVIMMAAWSVGSVLSLLWAGLGRLRLRKISRKARVVDDAGWLQLLDETRRSLRLRRDVILLQSVSKVMPLTWGWWRPVVLLPFDADRWTAERQRVVLLHELAHIKRWDYLTQWNARIVCALFWSNPLVWVAARRMRIERERACDDLVLTGGCKASDYADHLVEIARTFRRIPQVSGIPMARSSGLERRVASIVDASRTRHMRPVVLAVVMITVVLLALGLGGGMTSIVNGGEAESQSLRARQIARLEAFSVASEKQAQILAAAAGEQISPEFQRFFDAATKGDWQTVTNVYESFKKHHPQYSKGLKNADLSLRTSYWQPVLEICLAYDHVVNCDPQYTQMAIENIVNSIPAGSIYFGGTDPGRGLPTAFCKSHTDADPFYTVTQNALADGTYLEYLQNTYGERSSLLDAFIKVRRSDTELRTLDSDMKEAQQTLFSLYNGNPDDPGFKAAEETANKLQQRKDDRTKGIWAGLEVQANDQTTGAGKKIIYTPTFADSQRCFQEYLQDATRRLHKHQLKPGEKIEEVSNGPGAPARIQVSGQVAVMSINGLLAKLIFDKNPDREFYIEESFPLDWMYPHLEPHGLIMKINRQPLVELPENVVRQDHECWRGRVNAMIGDWLHDKGPVQVVADFVEKVYLRKDLDGFNGDRRFVQNDSAGRSFSHWRASIADLYAWRAAHAAGESEKARMALEADFAFRQAWALCPYSPDVVKRYTDFLNSQDRQVDANLVAASATEFPPAPEPNGVKSQGQAAGRPKSPVFEVRLVLDAPSDDTERMTLVLQHSTSSQVNLEPLYVQKEVLLDQTAVQSATVARVPLGGTQIEITLTEAGLKRFAEVTRRNIGKRLAIVIDGRVCSAAMIRSEIPGGKASISDSFSDEEARALAGKINEAVAK